MYATNGLADILGVTADQLKGKSFYYCIAENCLQDAIKCLESAKANDSIAYLRFWFRNPLQDDEPDGDVQMEDVRTSDSDEDDGGVHLERGSDGQGTDGHISDTAMQSDSSGVEHRLDARVDGPSRHSSGNDTDLGPDASDAIFDRPRLRAQSSTTSVESPNDVPSNRRQHPPIEVEAVVSCTSDGLVVILRRAKPMLPQLVQRPTAAPYRNAGIFAAPWALDPVLPPMEARPQYAQVNGFHPSLAPQRPTSINMGGPDPHDFMTSIRETAVFAWSLTGINGSLAQYSRGKPVGEAVPLDGLPIWDPNSNADPENKFNGFADNSHRRVNSGENWGFRPRSAQMPPWRPPRKRASGWNGSNINEDDAHALRRMHRGGYRGPGPDGGYGWTDSRGAHHYHRQSPYASRPMDSRDMRAGGARSYLEQRPSPTQHHRSDDAHPWEAEAARDSGWEQEQADRAGSQWEQAEGVIHSPQPHVSSTPLNNHRNSFGYG